MDGGKSTASLAVLLAGIRSAREGRRVEIAEFLEAGDRQPAQGRIRQKR
jgi:hypothetical protein